MNDTISRNAAIDAAIEAADEWDGGHNLTRANMIADAINNIAPSAQPERTCVNCGRTVNNGGWYADGSTRQQIRPDRQRVEATAGKI